MQSSHRILAHPSSSISSTCRNPSKGCKSLPHLPVSRSSSNSDIFDIPSSFCLCTFFSPSILSLSLSSRFSKRFFGSKSSSSAERPNPPRAGVPTRAMPNTRKGKGASREVDISKGLSYLLRHGAKNEGVRLDEAGWANVADVVGFLEVFSLFLIEDGCIECFF